MRTAIAARTLALLLFLIASGQTLGAVVQVKLPADYADFAMHPETGTVAALSAETNEVVFFRLEDLSADAAKPIAKVKVGATPCSLFYKKFQDLHVFAVVCSQDSHMYLINAGGAGSEPKTEFQLLKKIDLAQNGVSYVTGSINQQDPLLYFCYGGGHDSATGVVSLREMRAHGKVFDNSMDCAISASGEVAYRRGPHSPSGFESLVRTNSLQEVPPQFTRLFHDHIPTAQYIPDPFDRFTAAGTNIFSVGLDKREATLDFIPYCFFTSKPLVIGLVENQPQNRAPANPELKVTLQAASYNTFTNIGERVEFTRQLPVGDRNLPRGLQRQSDFKRVAKRFRLLADDRRARIIYAEADMLHLVPLEEFKVPDEPYLQAQLDGPDVLLCDQENELRIVPLDERVEITWDDLPAGMTAKENHLTWRPQPDQVGQVTLVATIKHASIQRAQRFELEVAYPSTKLPFAPSGFVVDKAGIGAAVWEGPTFDVNGQPRTPSQMVVRIALLNLETGAVVGERQVADYIGRCILTEENLLLMSAQQGSPRCEVVRRSDLQRATTLVASSPILHMDVFGDVLAIQGERELELYDLATFKRLNSFTVNGNPTTSLTSEHGVLVNGVLFGFDLQPKLVLHPGPIFPLGGNRNPQLDSLGLTSPVTPQIQPLAAQTHDGRIATVSVPGENIQVGLDVRRQHLQIPGSIHTNQTKYELSLIASGAVDDRQVVVRRHLYGQMSADSPLPTCLLQATKRNAFVISEDNLYRWELPRPTDEIDKLVAAPDLNWIPKQSTLTAASSGDTILKHDLVNAKLPITFSIVKSFDGMQIDANTGVITIDNATVLAKATQEVEEMIKQVNRGESFTQTLRTQADKSVKEATNILGRKPVGFPVAIPIHITATDADIANSSLLYFVIAEIPAPELLSKMTALDKQREEQVALKAAREKTQQRPAKMSETPAGSSELSEINRKIDALEQRLDLITRQLNTLLQKLDENETP